MPRPNPLHKEACQSMTLHQLLDGIVADTANYHDCAITGITCDSRQVEAGSVFFCIKGTRADGHDYAAAAREKGAAAIIGAHDMGVPGQIIVPDTSEAWGIAAANYFDNPAKKLKLLGVTGTNGKTSTTYIIKQILEQAGKKVGLVGTIQNEIGDMIIPSRHSTPDPYQLHALFDRMVKAGCEYVVMEVSSHALEQKRVAGCQFLAAVFSNLTQDHLDYHGTMENYYQAKKKLFDRCDTAVINYDDETGRRLISEIDCPYVTFSCTTDTADYIAHSIKCQPRHTNFVLLHGSSLYKVSFPIPGLFSVSNAMAAICACLAAGLSIDTILSSLSACRGIPGRIEHLDTDTPYTIIRDYAHSPDSLEKILTAVRAFATGRVVILFGCAGNRDRTKRAVMAQTAARLADFCILTSDNPRDEDPLHIIADAKPGFKLYRTPHKIIPDRYDAIQWALANSMPDDILVLAGKGHEDYQVLQSGTIFFDEKAIVAQILAQNRK